MSSDKQTASVCATLVLLGLLIMIGTAGLSNGTGTAQIALTSYGTIVASSNQYNGLIVFQNSTMNYLENKQGQITMSSSNPTAVINAAIGSAASGDMILIEVGTYVMTGSITSQSRNSITLTLASGAILKASNNFVVPIIYLKGASNWIVQGGELDGNAANQPYMDHTYGKGVGILMERCSGCTIQNMYMHDFRILGILLGYGCSACKILDNHITGCGANDISVGDDWSGSTTQNCLVQGNLIEHCNDVGITLYGANCQVLDNTVQNLGYAYSGYVGTKWGIGFEGRVTAGNLVQGNTVNGAVFGICQGSSGTTGKTTNQQIISNTVQSSVYCIELQGGNGNTISNNILSGTGTGIGLMSNSNTGSGNSYGSLRTHVSNQGTGNNVT
jgi:parallel beta-helix repeat protein